MWFDVGICFARCGASPEKDTCTFGTIDAGECVCSVNAGRLMCRTLLEKKLPT